MFELDNLYFSLYNLLQEFPHYFYKLPHFFSTASGLTDPIVCLNNNVILTGCKLLYCLSYQVQAYTRLHAVRQSASSDSDASTSGA